MSFAWDFFLFSLSGLTCSKIEKRCSFLRAQSQIIEINNLRKVNRSVSTSRVAVKINFLWSDKHVTNANPEFHWTNECVPVVIREKLVAVFSRHDVRMIQINYKPSNWKIRNWNVINVKLHEILGYEFAGKCREFSTTYADQLAAASRISRIIPFAVYISRYRGNWPVSSNYRKSQQKTDDCVGDAFGRYSSMFEVIFSVVLEFRSSWKRQEWRDKIRGR